MQDTNDKHAQSEPSPTKRATEEQNHPHSTAEEVAAAKIKPKAPKTSTLGTDGAAEEATPTTKTGKQGH